MIRNSSSYNIIISFCQPFIKIKKQLLKLNLLRIFGMHVYYSCLDEREAYWLYTLLQVFFFFFFFKCQEWESKYCHL